MPRGIPNSTLERPNPANLLPDDITEEEIELNAKTILQREKESAERLSRIYSEKYAPSASAEAPPDRRHYCYWAKCDRQGCRDHPEQKGYIFHDVGPMGPGGQSLVANYAENTHATPLLEYGQWPANNQAYSPGRTTLLEDGLNAADYNWRRPWGSFHELFKAGGVFRMPIEQFIQCGFHNDEDLARDRWDALKATAIYICEYCPNQSRYFTSEANRNSHYSVWHKDYQAAEINSAAMGKIWARQNEATNNVLGEIINRLPTPDDSVLLQEMRRMAARLEELESKKGTTN